MKNDFCGILVSQINTDDVIFQESVVSSVSLHDTESPIVWAKSGVHIVIRITKPKSLTQKWLLHFEYSHFQTSDYTSDACFQNESAAFC